MGKTSLNGSTSYPSRSVPVNKVGGPINRVDDPSGVVCENTGGTGGYRFLTDEAIKIEQRGRYRNNWGSDQNLHLQGTCERGTSL